MLKYNSSNPSLLKISVEFDQFKTINLKQFCAICTFLQTVLVYFKAEFDSNYHMDRVKRIWYLSPMRAAKVQASLRIRAVSPEPSLLAHTSSESRGTFRQKARSLAPLNGWTWAVEICHDGMLEDTNSLDAAHILLHNGKVDLWQWNPQCKMIKNEWKSVVVSIFGPVCYTEGMKMCFTGYRCKSCVIVDEELIRYW